MWLLENPVPALVIGTITAVLLGAMWLQSGSKRILFLMLGVIAATVAAILLERLVDTDREQVSATLHQIARDVERNDVQAASRHVHSSVPRIRQQAVAEMQRWTFEQVDIKPNLKVDVFADEEPPRALAEFNVMVILSDDSGTFKSQRVPRFFRISLLKEDGRWRVADYEHFPPVRTRSATGQ